LPAIAAITLRGSGLNLVADSAGPGESQPVLFLHGSGQTRHSWRKAMADGAQRGYRTISVDLRGHGKSDWAGTHRAKTRRPDQVR